MQAELEAGPAAHGWSEDQRWTLARIAELIHRLFGHRYTPRGVSYLLHRLGWSPQVPVHRAVERDEQAVARWRTEQWSRVRGRPRPCIENAVHAACRRLRAALDVRAAGGDVTPTAAELNAFNGSGKVSLHGRSYRLADTG
ncbi:winged helix-turn-helix domain-containing protein [Streptomyces sp. NPDC093088]|uniref:helix-turn-helix domain-containing protein n=1 Tax=Streptomyces sp. NPDC093088 TaxID=3366023 RepID=UPI00381EF9F1